MNELRSYAERREFEVAAEYIETASGAVRSRPQLDRMLRDVRSRKADIVLVWTFDSSGCRYLDSQQPCHWLIEYQAVSS